MLLCAGHLAIKEKNCGSGVYLPAEKREKHGCLQLSSTFVDVCFCQKKKKRECGGLFVTLKCVKHAYILIAKGALLYSGLIFPPCFASFLCNSSSISVTALHAWASTFVAAKLDLAAGMRNRDSMGKKVGSVACMT